MNRYHIYTSSNRRQSGTNENYSSILMRPMILTNAHHYWKCIVKCATIPYVFSQVTTGYNQFSYVMTRGGVTYPQKTFTIDNGNYTINSLITEVTAKMVVNIHTYLPSYNPTFNWTYDRDQMWVDFLVTPDGTDTSFTIKPLADQISTMMGVVTDTTFYTVGALSYMGVSTQPVNVNPVTSLFIRSSTLKQSYLSSESIYEPDDSSDILCQIPLYGQPTTWIQYMNELTIENKLSNEIINDINLYLSDNRSNSLSLRGIPWSCMLTFIEIAPPINNYINEIRKDIRHGNAGVNDVIDGDLKYQEFKKGAPSVEMIAGSPAQEKNGTTK